MRRALVMLTVVGMLASSFTTSVAARSSTGIIGVTQFSPTSLQTGAKSLSGQIAQSDAKLLARNDRAVVNIIVKLDVDALASYAGGVDNLAATSPSITGRPLKAGGAAVGAYQRYLNRQMSIVRRNVQGALPSIKLGRNFLVVFGGFAAQLPANKAKDLLHVPGVVAVMSDTVNQPTANDSPNFVGAPGVWSTLGGENMAGAGVKVGVLDTGIWPEHPMLLDPGIPAPGGGPYGCEFGLSTSPDDPSFICNDKMLGAYAFMDTNMLVNALGADEYCNPALTSADHPYGTCSARDADGHGTHTSTTAAGSPVDHAVLNGTDYGHISGIAPGASVIMYRVCGASTGCYTTDTMGAVEQAINDDDDVINFSISGGSSAYSDGVELAFLDAYAAGILVNASAGNSGPGAATSDHAGGWTNTVGASTLDRAFATTLHLTADGGATLNVPGVTVSGGVTSATPVVLGEDTVSGLLCDTAASGGDYTGEVVVCQRGTNARIEKGYNVSLGDAVGMILYNTAATDLETDNHFLPAVHVNDAALTIKAFVEGHTNVMATWTNGVPTAAQGDVMASFSSRGPLGDFIKPDVTAPGVQIFAGNTPKHIFAPADGLGPNDQLYQAIAGTSMSSPHAAGVAALLKAAHPSWTPGQIKSAMMTSAVQDVVKEDGSTPSDPFDRGAGSIRADRADDPTVTFDVTAPQYFGSASDPFGRINLNLPSINAPNMPGQITTTRTAQNVTGVSQTINISATAHIIVTPSTITLAPWGSASFTVKIDGQKLADGQYFGKITLDPVKAGYRNAVLPVAWDKHPGDVTLENSCVGPATFVAQILTIKKGETAHCSVTAANYANTDAHVQVKVKAPNTGRLIIKNWTAGNKSGNGFVWNGTLGPALAPEIISIDAPGYGYLSMPGLGVAPETGYGDETIGTYEGLPVPFYYGGETYDSLAIDSNGYLVIGSGVTAADNNCCNPAMPDPTRPNNVLAPYWTDLDAGSGGDIYFALVNFGGGVYYYVIEWHQVPVYGTANERTFQVWLGAGGAGEDIAFEYCVAPNAESYPADGCDDTASLPVGPGAPDGLVVGAENRDGTSAATIGPMDTQPYNDGYVVHAGSPTAGGIMTIDYDAFGKKTGKFDVKATLTSDVTQGTDFQIVKIKVVLP
ncbi:MAG: S8 family serine peptidase [Candidatus Limnocylindrales bacterium]